MSEMIKLNGTKIPLKKARRVLYFFIESFIAFLVVYFVLFFGGGLIPVGELKTSGQYTLYVQTNGVHTDICMPATTEIFDWTAKVPIADFPNAEGFDFIAIGWGDKGFFLDTPTWGDLTFKTAFNAAFLPSGTAMHVAYLDSEPQESGTKAKVFIDASEFKELIAFISASFQEEGEHVKLIPNKGYWKNDNFYEANGSYHLFNTCNAWTNEALKIAGVKTGLFALSSDGIMSHLK